MVLTNVKVTNDRVIKSNIPLLAKLELVLGACLGLCDSGI